MFDHRVDSLQTCRSPPPARSPAPVPASPATPTARAVALHISSVDRHRSCSLNTATRYPAAQEEGAELASEHVVVDLGYEARGLRLTKAFLLRKYTDPAASTFTWVSTNIQTQERQGSRSVSANHGSHKEDISHSSSYCQVGESN
ncbi:hypothetical protein PR002_g28138 [Phytophthora rubi]|uniref:Uncharacterized protein n=1 Tax=Phytophthora rubi TaxID=129364 RepID=A0A6A3HCI4_9STRA|nr:hypothetical protein PR002_g28138 [Phytophthora rubi]